MEGPGHPSDDDATTTLPVQCEHLPNQWLRPSIERQNRPSALRVPIVARMPAQSGHTDVPAPREPLPQHLQGNPTLRAMFAGGATRGEPIPMTDWAPPVRQGDHRPRPRANAPASGQKGLRSELVTHPGGRRAGSSAEHPKAEAERPCGQIEPSGPKQEADTPRKVHRHQHERHRNHAPQVASRPRRPGRSRDQSERVDSAD